MSRNLITMLSAGLVVAIYFAWPLLTYQEGTSRDVSVEVVAQPFGDGPELVYRWSGDVYRSCDVEILREITDSENVVTRLTSLLFKAPPINSLGYQSYEVTLPVPRRIAAGPAIYQATEVPRCSWMQDYAPIGIPYPPVSFIVTR